MKSLIAIAVLGFTSVLNAADIYGGNPAVAGTNTGNWHTQVIGGTWWLVDPLGNGFHPTGIYNIGFGDGGAWPAGGTSHYYDYVFAKYSTDITHAACQFFPAISSRMDSWGFNTIYGGMDLRISPFTQNSTCWSGTVDYPNYAPAQYRHPTVLYYHTSTYGMQNRAWDGIAPATLTQPVKDINFGLNFYIGAAPFWSTAGEADFFDSRLYSYFDYDIPNDGNNVLPYGSMPSGLKKYVFGALIDEADEMFSFTTGGDNPAVMTGKEHSQGGLRVLRTSPLQTANYFKNAMYPDATVYSKAVGLRNYLKAKYATIAALNTAWGSSYSACDMEGAGDQLGSCGTQVTAEAFATSNGSTATYSHTLAHLTPSQHSIQILVGGVMVAGDLGYNAAGECSNLAVYPVFTSPGCPPAGPSQFYGNLIDSANTSVNYSTGAMVVKFKTGTVQAHSIHGTGTVVTVQTGSNSGSVIGQHGAWVGAHVTISGTTNYNLSGVVASVIDSYTFTISNSATGVSEFAGIASFTDSAPPNGTSITVTYVQNGWGVGAGLMDEDGRNSTCLGSSNDTTNAVTLNLCGGSPISTSWQTGQTLGTVRTDAQTVGTWFTAGSASITKLCRWVGATHTQTHLVKLVKASDGSDVPGGSVSIDASLGTPGSTQCVALASPVALTAGADYYVAGNESGDTWYDLDTTVTVTSQATRKGSVYNAGGSWITGAGAFGPYSFSYQTGTAYVYNSPALAGDLEGFLGAMATQYFSNMDTVFSSHFGSGTSRTVLNLGPDPLIYWTSPSHAGVLAAAGTYLDVIGIQSYMSGFAITQTGLDWINANAGNKPLMNTDFIMAPTGSATGAGGEQEFDNGYTTQAARGTGYLGHITSLTHLSYTSNAVKPYIGTAFWQWTDETQNPTNFGLVTPQDNAYDAHETTTGTAACSAPLAAYVCGGESGNYGDVITPVKAANALWLSLPTFSVPTLTIGGKTTRGGKVTGH